MSIVRYFNPTLRRKLLAGEVPDWLKRHPRRRYIEAANKATPDWVDRDQLKRIREYAHLKSIALGVELVLDHIVPLNHPYVCGLGVPWNLRIITRAQNAAKCGKWSPDQMELPL